MTVTVHYTWNGDPSASKVEEVRDLIGDTDSSQWLLSDEQIQIEINKASHILLAASNCCQKIAAKFARRVNFSTGKTRGDHSDLHKHFITLAKELKAQYKAGNYTSSTPNVGKVSDVQNVPDRIEHSEEVLQDWDTE